MIRPSRSPLAATPLIAIATFAAFWAFGSLIELGPWLQRSALALACVAAVDHAREAPLAVEEPSRPSLAAATTFLALHPALREGRRRRALLPSDSVRGRGALSNLHRGCHVRRRDRRSPAPVTVEYESLLTLGILVLFVAAEHLAVSWRAVATAGLVLLAPWAPAVAMRHAIPGAAVLGGPRGLGPRARDLPAKCRRRQARSLANLASSPPGRRRARRPRRPQHAGKRGLGRHLRSLRPRSLRRQEHSPQPRSRPEDVAHQELGCSRLRLRLLRRALRRLPRLRLHRLRRRELELQRGPGVRCRGSGTRPLVDATSPDWAEAPRAQLTVAMLSLTASNLPVPVAPRSVNTAGQLVLRRGDRSDRRRRLHDPRPDVLPPRRLWLPECRGAPGGRCRGRPRPGGRPRRPRLPRHPGWPSTSPASSRSRARSPSDTTTRYDQAIAIQTYLRDPGGLHLRHGDSPRRAPTRSPRSSTPSAGTASSSRRRWS